MSASDPLVRPGAYLVNGLPSLLSRRVLEQVLCFEPRVKVFCIVHPDDVDYTERVLALFEESQRSRVELFAGDLTAIDFGLSGSEYLTLGRHVAKVHHVVTPGTLYVDAENQAAVGAALGREIVEFARAAPCLQNCVVYSTAGVSGDRTGTVMENELVRGQGFPNPFAQALALMELMVRKAEALFPSVVVRPTLLSGDSQTGECETTSPLYRLVEAILRAPENLALRVPAARAPVHMVAVDYVARAAYYVGRRRDTVGRTLHLTGERPRSLSALLKLVLLACERKTMETRLGSNVNPRLQPPANDSSRDFARASAALNGPNVYYDARQSAEVLGESGIACPPFEDYADKIVSYVRRQVG